LLKLHFPEIYLDAREEITGLKFMIKVRISPFLSTNGIHI
jgi:hypothetical protein